MSLLFSYLFFWFFFYENTDNEVPLRSHIMTYPLIAPPTTRLGSFGLNSNDIISNGDDSTNTGSIEWISSKSQNTTKDLCDLT